MKDHKAQSPVHKTGAPKEIIQKQIGDASAGIGKVTSEVSKVDKSKKPREQEKQD